MHKTQGVFNSRQVGFMLPSRPHQDLQRTTLQALRRTHGCRKWLKLDLRRTHDGPKMAPRWPRIAPNVPKMDPRWPHEAPRHTIIKICVLAHKNWGVRSRPCLHRSRIIGNGGPQCNAHSGSCTFHLEGVYLSHFCCFHPVRV